ncbi:hypothetical protein PISL3812_08224 [Talaromyces islandicus]|uniref:Uncharacterized protein n=1 Tax=Talaromyces islandicus TaxID=28573 RepID=A0A0U1M8D6_TALIS|nr:hypothetical protein PISL3812_08224 [Talaromyces islandicus]
MYGRIRVVVRGAFFPAQFRSYSSQSIVHLASLHKWLLLYLLLDYNSKRRWALPIPALSNAMAAIGFPGYQPKIHELAKRNWASKNPGVILVFCIVFIVALGVGLLFLYRRLLRKRAEKQAYNAILRDRQEEEEANKKQRKEERKEKEMSKNYRLTFITPLTQDNGIFKPVFRQPYPSLPIRITLPKLSSDTLPPASQRVVVDRVLAKVQYGAGCTADEDLFNTIGLSTVVDCEGFREIRSSHMSEWIVFGEDSRKPQSILNSNVNNGLLSDKKGITIKARTAKTGVVEIRNIVFHVVARYQIAVELRFDDGQAIGRTPWQAVEVQVQMQGRRRVADGILFDNEM